MTVEGQVAIEMQEQVLSPGLGPRQPPAAKPDQPGRLATQRAPGAGNCRIEHAPARERGREAPRDAMNSVALGHGVNVSLARVAARGTRAQRRRGPARVRVELLPYGHEKTPRTGPAASIHEANLWVGADVAPRLLTADFLGSVAAEYRRFLGKVSGALLRTRFEPGYESLVLLFSRTSLLRFRAPVYGEGPDWAELRWSIESGLLVAPVGRGRGSLRLYLRRLPSRGDGGEELVPMLARMEVDGYYPRIRGGGRFAGIGAWLYAQTQARIHTLIMRGFLRFLSRIEVPPTPTDSPVIVARGNA
jgi:hypothetical protein